MWQEQQHDLSHMFGFSIKYWAMYVVHLEPEVNKEGIVSRLALCEVPVKFTCRHRTFRCENQERYCAKN